MKNIVVLDAATMRGDLLRPTFSHCWTSYELTRTEEEAVARTKDAHILITNKVKISADVIAAAGQLELIAVAATGVDIVDLDACRARRVMVCNVRNYATRSVAEHVLALIFSLARGVTEHHCRTMAGEWVASNVFSPNMGAIFSVKNMQLGIVGAGTLGRATAELAESVGMRIVYAYRNSNANQREKKDGLQRLLLPELLAESDVVSLHCPLTPQTHGLIGAKELALMKPTALLINTARGALVESQALVDALNSGQLGGAGIDVLSQEPPSNEPLLSCHHPRLLITPHVGWASTEALRTFHQQLAENLECFHAGKPQHVVT